MTPAVVPPITAPVLMEDVVPEGVAASVMVKISSTKSPGGHCIYFASD